MNFDNKEFNNAAVNLEKPYEMTPRLLAEDNEMLSRCPSGWILSEIKLALKNSSENSRIVKVSIWKIAFLDGIKSI